MDSMIEIENLTKDYGNGRGIYQINLAVEKGDICGIVSANNITRTIFVQVLLGMAEPDAGRCQIRNEDCFKKAKRIHQAVGYVPEKLPDLGKLTGIQYLKWMLAFRKVKNKDEMNRLIIRFGVNVKLPVEKLSGCERKKLAFISGFMHQPELCIIETPGRDLDAKTRRIFYDVLREKQQAGTTILLMMDEQDSTEKLCSRIVHLENGKIVDVFTNEGREETQTEISTPDVTVKTEKNESKKGFFKVRKRKEKGSLVKEIEEKESELSQVKDAEKRKEKDELSKMKQNDKHEEELFQTKGKEEHREEVSILKESEEQSGELPKQKESEAQAVEKEDLSYEKLEEAEPLIVTESTLNAENTQIEEMDLGELYKEAAGAAEEKASALETHSSKGHGFFSGFRKKEGPKQEKEDMKTADDTKEKSEKTEGAEQMEMPREQSSIRKVKYYVVTLKNQESVSEFLQENLSVKFLDGKSVYIPMMKDIMPFIHTINRYELEALDVAELEEKEGGSNDQ